MTEIEALETKLNNLCKKWIGHVPKSSADPNWWEFRCDSCIASRLKRQIEEAKKNNLEAMVKDAFGVK